MKTKWGWATLIFALTLVLGGITPAQAADGYPDKFICRVYVGARRPAPGTIKAGGVVWDQDFTPYTLNAGGKFAKAGYDDFLGQMAAGTAPQKVQIPPGTDVTNLYVRHTGGPWAEIWQAVNNPRGTWTVKPDQPRWVAPYGRQWLSPGTCYNLYPDLFPQKSEPVPFKPQPAPAPTPPAPALPQEVLQYLRSEANQLQLNNQENYQLNRQTVNVTASPKIFITLPGPAAPAEYEGQPGLSRAQPGEGYPSYYPAPNFYIAPPGGDVRFRYNYPPGTPPPGNERPGIRIPPRRKGVVQPPRPARGGTRP